MGVKCRWKNKHPSKERCFFCVVTFQWFFESDMIAFNIENNNNGYIFISIYTVPSAIYSLTEKSGHMFLVVYRRERLKIHREKTPDFMYYDVARMLYWLDHRISSILKRFIFTNRPTHKLRTPQFTRAGQLTLCAE